MGIFIQIVFEICEQNFFRKIGKCPDTFVMGMNALAGADAEKF